MVCQVHRSFSFSVLELVAKLGAQKVHRSFSFSVLQLSWAVELEAQLVLL